MVSSITAPRLKQSSDRPIESLDHTTLGKKVPDVTALKLPLLNGRDLAADKVAFGIEQAGELIPSKKNVKVLNPE